MDKEALKIIVRYFTNKDNKEYAITAANKSDFALKKIAEGDWIDLRAAKTMVLRKEDFGLIPLGVAMKLPAGYEAHIAPRSSTFLKYGILQANSFGIIDNSYSGDKDEWKFPFYATRDVVIEAGTRIAQFRIFKKMPEVYFEEVDHLLDESRGGFGKTGTK